MGLFGISKKEADALKAKIEELEAKVSPEQNNIDTLKSRISQLEEQKAQLEEQKSQLDHEISLKKKQVVELDDEILYQSVSLYKPLYNFANSDEYKAQLKEVRAKQKEMIRKGTACVHAPYWSLNGSTAAGRKLVSDHTKVLLRCFNAECENIVGHVKYSNIDNMTYRMLSSYEMLNSLSSSFGVSIRREYLDLKLQELHFSIEYAMKKQEEKEQERRAREELREQRKLEAEIAAVRDKIAKDRKHFNKAIHDIESKLASATDENRSALESKLAELHQNMADLDAQEREVDYREKNAKAGYVYVISNIGSFGENVYKIGMTRRLQPMDRVDELGDASVPFRFDVHALIFSDDAPALESALHKAFEDRRVNLVNNRKEFFHVTLDEIKDVVRANYDQTVDFTPLPEATEYRQSKAQAEQVSA